MSKRLGTLALLLSLVLVVVVGVYTLAGCSKPVVPDVVGMRQAEAVRALQDAGYKLGDVSMVATSAVDLGTIAGQKPAAGEAAKEGSAVSLAVSFSNGTRAIVPNVTGVSRTTAEGIAATLGFEGVVVEQYDGAATVGVIAGQVPQVGANVDAGSLLVMVVSKGGKPEEVVVPDVKSKSRANAEEAICAVGLESVSYEIFSSEVAKGSVIAQVPDPGESVLAGSSVEIVVSKGKGTGAVSVPNVIGKTSSAAATAIEGSGLKTKVVYDYDSKVRRGVVGRQFPASASAAAKGSEVLVVVSKGAAPAPAPNAPAPNPPAPDQPAPDQPAPPNPPAQPDEPASTVKVPKVVGKTQADAEALLGEAGFAVTIEKAGEESDEASVLYQYPAAGTAVPPGSGVLVVVGVKTES